MSDKVIYMSMLGLNQLHYLSTNVLIQDDLIID